MTGNGPMAARKNSNLTLRRASTASFRGPRGKMNDEEENKGNAKTKQSKEFSEQGKVKWDVYKEYAKNSNLIAVTIYMFTLIGAKTAEIGKSPLHLARNLLIVGKTLGSDMLGQCDSIAALHSTSTMG